MAISVNFIGDGKVTERWRYGDAFDPAKHPRGQPENKGEFGSGGGAALKAKPTAAKRKLAAAVLKPKFGTLDPEALRANNVSPEVGAYISQVLTALGEKYPEVGRHVSRVVFTPKIGNEFDQFDKELRFSRAGLDKGVAEADRWTTTSNKAGFNVGGGLQSLLTHEFGHAADNYVVTHGDDDLKTEWFATKKALEKSIGPASEYAKHNDSEWLAEQFTAEELGHRPLQFLPVLQDFIKRASGVSRWRDAFDPAKHPRGQPENAGEFASVSGGGQSGIKVEPEDPSSPERLAWNILLNGKKIGRATATGGADGDFLDAVRIDQEHQNKGYSTEIYNQIEQHLGHKLLPSPLGLSPQATAVWKRRLAKLTPEQRLDIVNRSKVIGREFGLRDEHLNNRLDPLLGEPDAAGEIVQGREATGADPGAPNDFSRHKLAPVYYLATSTSISLTSKIASLKDKLNNSFYDDDDKSYIRGWLDYLQAQQAPTAPHVTVTGDVPVTKLGGGNSVPRPEPEPLDDYKYATQSNEEFKAETGIDVIRDPDSHVLRNTGETRKLIAGLPASHRALLKNTKFYTKGVISTSGLNMAVKADSYVGLYDRANDTITVADGYKLPDGTTALASAPYYAIAAHEIGHAIDLKLGNALSDDPEVIRLLNRDENRLTPAQSRAASYYMQDKREIVAECYAMLFAPSARAFNMPFHVAQECFFRTLFGLKQALHRNGLDTYE